MKEEEEEEEEEEEKGVERLTVYSLSIELRRAGHYQALQTFDPAVSPG